MKRRLCISLMALCAVVAINAQTLNVKVGNTTYAFPAGQTGDMLYSSGTTVEIMGRTFNVSDIDVAYIDGSVVTDNTVTVNYNDATATVVVAGNIARYIEPTITGAYVSIEQSAEVDETTCGEISYLLSGASSDGSFYLLGSYKATIELQGLELISSAGAAMDIQNGKRIKLSIAEGTVNTLTDCADGTQKGTLVCKGHLELKGHGTLNVYGNTSHAIYAKEYIEMKNCTVNILAAQKDGINCNQYFTMESGELNIQGTGDDGIQTSFKDDVDREPEDTGTITISGGTITASVTATAAKAMKADGSVIINGGTLTLSTSGGGEWDTEDVKTKASTCISADSNVQIDGGTLNLTSTGSGGKGISCDNELIVNGGDIIVVTSGGLFAYVNGIEYENYTGNTDYLDSDYKSSPKGIKADGNISINGGNINVTTTGNGGEGIESKAVMTINDGTITINSYDDGLNSSSHLYINGGDITVVATNNDAIDSNGDMYIAGGYIRAFGAAQPEGGIDANEEEGYSVYFTGGTLVAVGGRNSTPSSSASTQPYVSGTATVTAGNTISLSSGSTTLATFTVPDNYSSSSSGGPGGGGPGGGGPGGMGNRSSVLITCDGLTAGNTYTLTCGSSTSSVTAR